VPASPIVLFVQSSSRDDRRPCIAKRDRAGGFQHCPGLCCVENSETKRRVSWMVARFSEEEEYLEALDSRKVRAGSDERYLLPA